ncbi:MAG: DUF333 domain-containing protein [Lautropia sp.]|nr:DUF333 domain-containing protein [Lautropia sp.]
MKSMLLMAAALALPACTVNDGQEQQDGPQEVGSANPASLHCLSLGGRLEIRDEEGGQVGYCHLPGGEVVEEWALYRSAGEARSD